MFLTRSCSTQPLRGRLLVSAILAVRRWFIAPDGFASVALGVRRAAADRRQAHLPPPHRSISVYDLTIWKVFNEEASAFLSS